MIAGLPALSTFNRPQRPPRRVPKYLPSREYIQHYISPYVRPVPGPGGGALHQLIRPHRIGDTYVQHMCITRTELGNIRRAIQMNTNNEQ